MNKNDIYKVLSDILPQKQISGLEIDEQGGVLFSILVDPAMGTAMEDLRAKAETLVLTVAGVTKVTAILTAQKPAVAQAPNDPHGNSKNPKLELPIRKIIAVASGKGGVGKSTVAVNIAAQIAKTGKSVGLLDADIYGPSVPRLTGLPYVKPDMTDDKKLIPFEAHGLKVMSIGFMVDPDTPMVWRGPMVQSAIYQMLRDVQWGTESDPLDILVIDMPPGTGDAQLTIAQKIDVDGAVIVSTPQDLALLDAVKAIEMFRKTDVPVLGLIENMSMHICTACGHEDHIFGHGGAKSESKKRNVAFLGEIPLSVSIRKNSDAGILDEENIFKDISTKVLQILESNEKG